MKYFRNAFFDPMFLNHILYSEEGYFRTYGEGSHWASGNFYGGFNLFEGDGMRDYWFYL